MKRSRTNRQLTLSMTNTDRARGTRFPSARPRITNFLEGTVATLVLASGLTVALPAAAEDDKTERELPRLGMHPGEPQVRSARPTVPVGIDPKVSNDDVLDIHGYMLLPARVGLLQREDPSPGQSDIALHSPPTIPQELRSFEYLAVVPDPWVQLNFTYGNKIISATAILSATTLAYADAISDPRKQLGVSDAFLTVNLTDALDMPAEVKVGAITGRYGAMGAYDAGRYATPLIARTNLIGEQIAIAKPFDGWTLVVEQGLGGQLGRPPQGLVPAGWNDFADPNVGASFVHHLHAGAVFSDLVHVGLHHFRAWSQDDSVNEGTIPDGSIEVFGADARFTLDRAGHLYLGVANTELINAESVSGVIEVLNARGGPELTREYLGPKSEGDGSLTTLGVQYDLSVARAIFGELYTGASPDILVSLFGVMTKVASDDPLYDDETKLKLGLETTYNMTSWFGASTRFDHVRLNGADDRGAMWVISPRLLFHTDWQSRDEIALQYSHFVTGSDVAVRSGSPPVLDSSISPDVSVFSLSGTFWW